MTPACQEIRRCRNGHQIAEGVCRACHRLRSKAQWERRKAERRARLNLPCNRAVLLWLVAVAVESQQRLIEDNKALAYWFVDKYYSTLSLIDRDDAIGEALAGIVRAARSFNPSKGAFTTYCHWWMRSAVSRWQALRAKPRPRPLADYGDDWESEDNGFNRGFDPPTPTTPDSLACCEEVERFRRLCDPVDWTCLWRSAQGDKYEAIGDDLGICKERVRQRIQRARSAIRWHVLKREVEEARA